jgi:hypothetical protein
VRDPVEEILSDIESRGNAAMRKLWLEAVGDGGGTLLHDAGGCSHQIAWCALAAGRRGARFAVSLKF